MCFTTGGAHGLDREPDVDELRAPALGFSMLGGKGPFDQIDMGGMFTIVKVRPRLTAENATGWYEHPPGTVAEMASDTELSRDGIKI